MRLSRAAIKWCRRRSLGIDGGGSYASFSTMRVRMPEEFSPIPAVNMKASRPPSARGSRAQTARVARQRRLTFGWVGDVRELTNRDID